MSGDNYISEASYKSGPVPRPGTRLRWRIGLLLGVGVLVNYFDRISLSVAAPALQSSLGLTSVELGVLLSAFFWSYALLQIPAGLLLDRYGVMTVTRCATLLWVVASSIAFVAGGLPTLMVSRILLGVAEAPCFPANAKAIGYWFPRNERSLSTAIFDAAAKFSNVIGVPVIAVATVRFGWRWGFALVAAFSALYAAAFWRLYRDPSRHPRLGREEEIYIHAHGALPEERAARAPAGMLGLLLRHRKVWALVIGFSAYGYCFYFF